MNERAFSVGERKFQLNKIDAIRQFHIVRRLGPMLGEIIPVAQKFQKMKQDNMTEADMLDHVALVAQPVMSGISKLSDEDANRVLFGLCSSVEMFQPQHNCWAFICNDKSFAFQDLDFGMLIQIAGRAFMYNLANFLQALPQTSHGGA